jgi:hypothetical protein
MEVGEMVKVIFLGLTLLANAAYASGANDLSRCAVAYVKASMLMAQAGDASSHEMFTNSAKAAMVVGQRDFGRDQFNQLMEANKDPVMAMSDDALVNLLGKCNRILESYAK